jgi:putative transposase
MTLAYATELTAEQYELLETLFSPNGSTGRPRTVNLMVVVQGILYILASG